MCMRLQFGTGKVLAALVQISRWEDSCTLETESVGWRRNLGKMSQHHDGDVVGRTPLQRSFYQG